jgi:hypothetical protein
MSKYRVTHSPPGSVDATDEEVEANVVRPIDAGDSHFLAFIWVDITGDDDIRLILPASTVYRIEKVD